MRKFTALLIFTMVLVGAWLVTLEPMAITPQAYLTLTAPWWHVVLHLAWVVSLAVTVFVGLYLAWDLRLRQRHKIASQPPDHANRR